MVIISSIKPDNLGIRNKIKYKYDNYVVYQEQKSFSFVHLLERTPLEWKNSVRDFLDNGQDSFLFIGKGEKFGDNTSKACIVEGHVNLSGKNPLVGKNADKYGPRFFDVTDLYSKKLAEKIFVQNSEVCSGNILIPNRIEKLTELENKVLNLKGLNFAGISKDIYAGALTAKHAKAKSAGLLLFQDEYDLTDIINLEKI